MLTGKNYIGYSLSSDGTTSFNTINPKTNQTNNTLFYEATTDEVNQAVSKAHGAFAAYQNYSGTQKSSFLTAIAGELLQLGDTLIKQVMTETGLAYERVVAERGRTLWQLQMFADLLLDGSWVDATIDTAIPDRKPIPKHDLRKMLIPLGPVVVFGASNFPLAYSTAGGDSVAALAAGCPVIVKSHPMHAGVSELVAGAVIRAAQQTGMPDGIFSHLNSQNYTVGNQLLKHPQVKAVGFTGSVAGGTSLLKLAAERPEPIPVFAEMGSINPVVLMPEALHKGGAEIAKTYAQSITLGSGQFCTNPGLLLGIAGTDLTAFAKSLADEILKTEALCMLHPAIAHQFDQGKKTMQNQLAVEQVVSYEHEHRSNYGKPLVLTVKGATFLHNTKLHQEVFGPFSLLVQCADLNELTRVITQLEGQLTGTFMATEKELSTHFSIAEALQNRVGRLIFNGVPTGVEVCPSMQHGGPFPASSDSRFTAVGIHSIKRWVRPISFQNWPNDLLPDALKNANPLQIERLVNNKRTSETIKKTS